MKINILNHIKPNFTAVLLTAFVSIHSFAGGMTTGGGYVISCPNMFSKTGKVSFLDTYEGQTRFGFSYKKEKKSVYDYLKDSLDRLDLSPNHKLLLEESIQKVIQSAMFLPKKVGLHTGIDLGNEYAVMIPFGCELKQLAYYEDDGKIRIVQRYFNKLSNRDRAAFILHEAIYKLAREFGNATNSASTRKLTAGLFSMDSGWVGGNQKRLMEQLVLTVPLSLPVKKIILPQFAKVTVSSVGSELSFATLSCLNTVGEITWESEVVSNGVDPITIFLYPDVSDNCRKVVFSFLPVDVMKAGSVTVGLEYNDESTSTVVQLPTLKGELAILVDDLKLSVPREFEK